MSDSKKFSQEIEINIEDRVKFFENILPHLTPLKEYLSLKKSFEELLGISEESRRQLEEERKKASDAKIYSFNVISDLQRKIDVLEKSVDLYRRDQQETIRKTESIQQSINLSHSKYKEIESQQLELKVNSTQLATKLEHKTLNEKIDLYNDALNKMFSEIHKFKSEINSLEKSIKLTEDKNSRASYDIQQLTIKTNGISQESIIYHNSMEKIVESFQSKMVSDDQKIRSYIDHKISDIKFPEVPKKEDVVKSVQQNIDYLQLDAKNAVARSTNAEMKLNLIEKKLEAVSLALQRIELTKKANE